MNLFKVIPTLKTSQGYLSFPNLNQFSRLKSTWHIHIKGLVQGVGFRPYVHLKAMAYSLTGWVSNTEDGVHLEFNGKKEMAFRFYKELIEEAPSKSKIIEHQIAKISKQQFSGFQIVHKQVASSPSLKITPDFALCHSCGLELEQTKDRRYTYPFISCTNCGPRFSILQRLPFDRENTSMEAFEMCLKCAEEYKSLKDRRYFSQNNSCPDCGIHLSLYDSTNSKITQNQNRTIAMVVHYWQQGKIVAIKGVGGYLLTCDAANSNTIESLRKRKHRPSKPFAMMYPNLEILEGDISISPMEIRALKSTIAPIVVCRRKSTNRAMDKKMIAPNLNQLGVMLPYTPLFKLLLGQFGRPIVATSGNKSNSPIIFEEDKIQLELSSVYDLRLAHNLKIVVPQDDSVVKFSIYHQQRIIMRRSRGFAPNYFNEGLGFTKGTILTTGASLKSTFCLHHSTNTYVSQYLGDLVNLATLESYIAILQHFLELLKCSPDVILSDKHPEYPSSQYGRELSEKLNIPFLRVQHHLAHFAAVLGENGLQENKNPVLGIVWDGTGYGNDGQLWGGEFFIYQNFSFLRQIHFSYFDWILGDKMAKEPRIAALSCCWNIPEAAQLLKDKFTSTEWQIYSKKLGTIKNLKTSSVGRIFDAVASLLDIMDTQTFEGEAAIQLETLAQNYFDANNMRMDECYFYEKSYLDNIPTQDLMYGVIKDILEGKPKDFIAAKFHFSLAKLIGLVAQELKIKHIAFSGGVFQNGLLVDLIISHLNKDFELYFHKDLAPNDENISFGQLMYYTITNNLK